MGKSLPSTTNLQEFPRYIGSTNLQEFARCIEQFRTPKFAKPTSRFRVKSPGPAAAKQLKAGGGSGSGVRVDSGLKKMSDISEGSQQQQQQNQRIPLAEVVSDCVKRWFQDTLKEAKSGDSAMQVLVGQMYYNGYGIPRDAQKGRAWISRASKNRSSVWKVCDKRPGYNASDSDSDDTKADAK